MNYPVKLIIKHIFSGVLWGCTFLVFDCLVGYYLGGQSFLLSIVNEFPKHVAGSVLVGIGYRSPAVIYRVERLSLLVKSLIHFSIGTVVFFSVAFSLGWIPFEPSQIGYLVLEFLVACITFMISWFVFYLFNHCEANKINNRLRELEREDVVGK